MWTIKQLLTLMALGALIMTNLNKVFTSRTPWQESNVLLVTAHPDDETMFFGPTIRNILNKPNNTLSIITLSTGDADGLGETRKKEMFHASHLIGVNPYNVKVINDTDLPDSMNVTWDYRKVAEHVAEAAAIVKPDFIITFDNWGISGHRNHQMVFKGVIRYALSPEAREHGTVVYTLDSVPLYRKYLFVFDSIIGRLQVQRREFLTLISSNYDYYLTRSALTKGHASQMTWYRKLWTFFSRYMVVNDLAAINLDMARKSELFYEPEELAAMGSTSHESSSSEPHEDKEHADL